MVLLVNQARLVSRVYPETIHRFHLTPQANACGAHLDRLDHQVPLDPLDQVDPKEELVFLVALENLAVRDPLDLLARLATKLPMANLDLPVLLGPTRPQAKRATMGLLDRKESPAQLEAPEIKVLLVNPDQPARLDPQAHLARLEKQATKDHLALVGRKEDRVRMPNIVLVLAVLTKTEKGETSFDHIHERSYQKMSTTFRSIHYFSLFYAIFSLT